MNSGVCIMKDGCDAQVRALVYQAGDRVVIRVGVFQTAMTVDEAKAFRRGLSRALRGAALIAQEDHPNDQRPDRQRERGAAY